MTPASPTARRRRIRRVFDDRVQQEWRRYAGDPRRVLVRTLRERFLRRHLGSPEGPLLEVGGGPGRFTGILRARVRGRLVCLDLSRASLLAGRRRLRRARSTGPTEWVQAAAEHLPMATGSIGTAVVLGNIVNFAGPDGPALLRELARVLRPGGTLVVDFASPAAAVQEFLHRASEGRFLPEILRRPRHYLLYRVLETGSQPYDPARWTQWEFRFYQAAEATSALDRAGFRTVDRLGIAPLAAHHGRIAGIARRDRRTWESLLRIEETVGRRVGTQEVGHGFVVAAVRRSTRPRRRRRQGDRRSSGQPAGGPPTSS